MCGVEDINKCNINLNPENVNQLLISYAHLKARIDNNGNTFNSSREGEFNSALYDLGVILQYNKLNNLANSMI